MHSQTIFAATAKGGIQLMNLNWNVYYYNQNIDTIEPFNVFSHRGFYRAVLDIFNKYQHMDEFEEAVDKEAMYYFWCKAEYEVFVSDWFKGDAKAKIDIYDQLKLNWNRFIDYLWSEYTKEG